MSDPTTKLACEPEAAAIIRSTEEKAPVHTVRVGIDQVGLPRDIIAVKNGFELFDLKPFMDEYLVRPERRKGTAVLSTLDSFVNHVARFKDEDSVLFCDDNQSSPKLQAVLDYNRGGATGEPRFGEHRALYAFPLSDEWKAWRAMNAKPMSQTDFARFIEDRLADIDGSFALDAASSAADWAYRMGISYASPSRILELSRGLQLTVKNDVRNDTRLDSGEGVVHFATAHEDVSGRPLSVPSAFLLAIPVFKLGPLYPVPVRLRYRVVETKLAWHYEMARVDAVFENAIDGACTQASSGTGLPLLRGQPE
jgi:uncharacterized protein YfdQ (DUF2303 family)